MTQPKNPDPNVVFPNEYKTSVFLKNIVSAPNIFVGDYTYYDSPEHPENFEKTQVLFNYPIFGDKLVIGKFCQIAHGTTFIMGAANHRLSSVSTYPFNVMGKAWHEVTPDHLSELPRKGDIVVGNDVGRSRKRHHAGRHNREWCHRGRLFGCDQRRRTLQCRRRQSGSFH